MDDPPPKREGATKPARPSSHPLAWSPSQRRALLVLLTILLLVLAIRYALHPIYVSDPQPEHPALADKLVDRIDPNSADLQTLAFLPNLGEKRAQAIIEYREKRKLQHPGETPFRIPEDLLAVKGIGAATVDNLRPFLIFPTTQPTTRR